MYQLYSKKSLQYPLHVDILNVLFIENCLRWAKRGMVTPCYDFNQPQYRLWWTYIPWWILVYMWSPFTRHTKVPRSLKSNFWSPSPYYSILEKMKSIIWWMKVRQKWAPHRARYRTAIMSQLTHVIWKGREKMNDKTFFNWFVFVLILYGFLLTGPKLSIQIYTCLSDMCDKKLAHEWA